MKNRATESKAPSKTSVLRIVALASKSGAYGGPFDTASRQCRIVESKEFEISLLAGFLKNDEPEPTVSVGGRDQFAPVRRVIPRTGFSALFSLKIASIILKRVRSADVVHISFSRELIPLYATAVAILLRKKTILQPHGMLTSRRSIAHNIVDLIIKPIYRQASEVIALTEVEEEDLRNWARGYDRYRIISNPLPLNLDEVRLSTRKADVPQVIWIARLHPRKDVSTFINAARYAGEQGWRERYVIVGPDEGELGIVQSSTQELQNLSYLGSVDSERVTRLVAQSHAFALTSRNEPWGNVLATALGLGIPCLVAERAALASLVLQTEGGGVFPDGDHEALAQRVHSTLSTTAPKDQPSSLPLSNSEIMEKLKISYSTKPIEETR